jgi:hypothetical protein
MSSLSMMPDEKEGDRQVNMAWRTKQLQRSKNHDEAELSCITGYKVKKSDVLTSAG